MQPLVFDRSPRIAPAAASCLAALGVAIYVNNGALQPQEPVQRQVLTSAASNKSAAQGRGGRGRGAKRKGGRGAPSDAAAQRSQAATGSASVTAQADAQAATAPRRLPPLAVLTWACALLTGKPCSHSGTPATAAERELLLIVLNGHVSADAGAAKARIAPPLLRALQRVLDADATNAAHLPGLLDAMHAAVEACTPGEAGAVLPDIVDVFLGWALDAECSQEAR